MIRGDQRLKDASKAELIARVEAQNQEIMAKEAIIYELGDRMKKVEEECKYYRDGYYGVKERSSFLDGKVAGMLVVLGSLGCKVSLSESNKPGL